MSDGARRQQDARALLRPVPGEEMFFSGIDFGELGLPPIFLLSLRP